MDFKPNIKKEDTVCITMTLSIKYIETYRDKADNLISNKEEIIGEFDRYIDIIKYGLYK